MKKAAVAALTVSLAREGKYGVTSNVIAPRARTRRTESMPNHGVFGRPESGIDPFDPAWPAELVAFLAREHAAEANGQPFVVWGGTVAHLRGWYVVGQIESLGTPITSRDLVARKRGLFGAEPPQPRPYP